MIFEEWIAANGFGDDLSDHQLGVLRALYDRNQDLFGVAADSAGTGGAQVLDVEGPFPNEHAARLRDPGEFDKSTFRRTKGGKLYGKIAVPADVSIIWAKLKAHSRPKDMPLPQSIRFPRGKWTVARAKTWLADNSVKYRGFEPASGPKSPARKAAGKLDVAGGSTPRRGPSQLTLIAEPELQFAGADDGDEKLPTFQMVAYTGVGMDLCGWLHPVVIDLKGLRLSKRPRPVLKEHDREGIVGHTTAIEKTEARLTVAGVISGTGAAAREVVESARNKFPWRVSIGARVQKMEFVDAEKVATANGKQFKGPVYVARKTTLGEISFVTVAADDDTSARIAATADGDNIGVTDMDYEVWLKAEGWNPEDLTEAQDATLRAAYDAQAGDKVKLDAKGKKEPKGKEKPKGADIQVAGATGTDTKTEAEVKAAAVEGERQRVSQIDAVCKGFEGERIEELRSKAMSEEIPLDVLRSGVIEHLRTERAKVTPTAAHADGQRKLVLATGYRSGAMPEKTIVEICGEPALEAASKLRGVGLQEYCAMAAQIDGVELPRYQQDPQAWLEAAFSTMSLPGILSNVANKMLLSSFEAVEDSWKRIAGIASVKDFKAVTSYRLTGNMEFVEVGPAGELQHGTMGEAEFTNQAKTYGRMFALTRTSIINDDMGALTATPRRIGRGGALKLNTVFWTACLNNGSFFTAGLGNFKLGATASLLTVEGMTNAQLLFMDQTDPDGDPVAVQPKILLVPNALAVAAAVLMKSTEVRDTTGSKKYLTANPHAGKYDAVQSSYLGNTGISGFSVKAWYLLANPADLATIEVVFLNGIQVPTVEKAEADFNVLGIQFRGYFDFGVALQEHRAGVKMKGEA